MLLVIILEENIGFWDFFLTLGIFHIFCAEVIVLGFPCFLIDKFLYFSYAFLGKKCPCRYLREIALIFPEFESENANSTYF